MKKSNVGLKYLGFQGMHLAFSPDGQRMVIAPFEEYSLRMLDVQTGKLLFNLDGNKYSMMDINFSPDGKLIVTASYDGTVRLFDAQNGELLYTDKFGAPALMASFSPDGTQMVAGGYKGTVKLYTLPSGY